MKAENNIQPEGILEQEIELFSQKDISEDNILFEDVKKRDERTKHFKTKDGKYIAVAYRNPVHMLNENTGEYVDISDSFVEKEDCFESKNPRYNARFPKEDSEESFVSIEKNGRSVGWRLRFKKFTKKGATVNRKGKHSKLEIPELPIVRYEGDSDDCALEYRLTERGIKEDIILSTRPNQNEFEFDFKLKGLTAILADDKKTIELFADNVKESDPEFVLPKITLLDAAGVYSEEAHYEIEADGEDFIVKIIVSDEWLLSDERVYPVIIDPQVMTYSNYGDMKNGVTIGSDNTKLIRTNFHDMILERVGYKSNGVEYRCFIELDYPELPAGAKITSAKLKLPQHGYSGSGEYEVCKIDSSWTSDGLAWNNQPSFGSVVYDTFVGKDRPDDEKLEIDLTADAEQFYSGSSNNHGIVLKASDTAPCNCDSNGNYIYSNQYVEFGYYTSPDVQVTYILMDEYADHQTYESFEVGRAGIGSVNLFTGKLHFVHNDISETGGHLPLSLSHIYRSDFAEIYENDTVFGKGWRLSACQTLNEAGTLDEHFATYVDANGRAHHFDFNQCNENEDNKLVYFDTSGLGFGYVRELNQIIDEKDNTMTFTNGKLTLLEDANGNKITYTYTNGKLTQIKDDMDRTATLEYNSSGKLSSITDAKGKKTLFAYNGDMLIRITYPDGSTTNFEYNDYAEINKVTDYSGINYRLTYNTYGRVSTIKQYGSKTVSHSAYTESSVLGSSIQFEYRAISTVVKDTISDIGQVYRFDENGRAVDSYEYFIESDPGRRSEITTTNIRGYEVKYNHNNNQTKGKYVSASAVIDGVDDMYPNYLTNGSFEITAVNATAPKGWRAGEVYSGIDGVVEEAYIEGHKSYKFNNTCCRKNKTIQQTVDLSDCTIDGNMLIASAWAKASSPAKNASFSDNENVKFELYAKLTFEDGTFVEETKSYDCGCTDWQYVAIPLAIESPDAIPVSAIVKFDFSGNIGTCLVSNVRLTKVRANYTHITNYTPYSSVEILGEEQIIVRHKMQTNWKKKTVTLINNKMDAVKSTTQIADGGVHESVIKYDDKHNPVKTIDYRNIVTECTYDSFGNVTREKIYHYGNSSVYLLSKADYYTNGRIKKVYDSRNDDYVTNYSYTSTYGLLADKIDPNEQKYIYTYDDNKRQTTVSAVDAYNDTYNITNEFVYDHNQLTQVKHNEFIYDFEYEPLGRNKSVKAAGNTLVSFAYVDAKYSKTTATYANGYTSVIEYDKYGNPTKKSINDDTIATANYDYRGNILKLVDNLKGVCYYYSYDDNGNIVRIDEKDGSTLVDRKSFTYDTQNRPLTRNEQSTGFTYETIYEETSVGHIYPDDTVKGVRLNGKFTDKIERDDIRRASVHKLTLDSRTAPFISDTYLYLGGSDGRATEFVRSVSQTIGSQSYSLAYTYDEMGNIKTVNDSDRGIVSYEYDGLNQLIEEYDTVHSRRVLYTYDKGGNITSKTDIYTENPSLFTTFTYTYDTVWKDRLVSYNGQSIVYDAIGNPTTYRGHNLTWTNVRRLASFDNNTYEYGADGIRTSKTVNGVTHNYTLNGNKIIKETFGSNTIKYFYGASGVVGFNLNGTDFYYRKNLQGDILAIVNASGSVVVEYAYDAWGKTLSTTGTLASILGTINPFRYRGYYYDTETKLYYLNSRYYDPEVGRFINADDIQYLGENGDFVNYNLFAYCNNNPVMFVDPTGNAWWHWALAAAVVVGCAVATVATCGGFAAAATSVCLVGNGIAAATTAATVTSAAFIGSSTAFGTAVLCASMNSDSLDDFGEKANWETVGSIAFSALVYGYDAYRTSTTKLYRSVGKEEAQRIRDTKTFEISSRGMDTKQFGFNYQETKTFGNLMKQNTIVSVRLPNHMIYEYNCTFVDAHIFKHGTLTVASNQLYGFNEAIHGTIRFFSTGG